MPISSYLPIFEITRGDLVESLHYGAAAVVNARGELVASYGDPQAVTYMRSSAKPFQALPLLEHGGQSAYHLTPREIAIICASHSGTDEHVATVRNLQEKVGVREEELLCGVHPPYHPATVQAMKMRGEEPTQNRNNCSGKHTGMLAYARLKQRLGVQGAFDLAYIDPAHPVQQDILHTFAEMCDLPADDIRYGIDGCSLPTFAVPLYNAALAFARLCDPQEGQVSPPARGQACRMVTAAMIAAPEMVGGPDSFDTRLMQVGKPRILSKVGAEGYLALGLLPGATAPGSPALGIAVKVADGDLGIRSANRPVNNRIRPAVALEILRQFNGLSPAELETLADYGPTFLIHNWRGLVVGEGRPCFQLT